MSALTRAGYAIATWFGCGYAPKAPGTAGTIGALPLYLLLRGLHPVPQWTIVVAIAAIGTWAAQRVADDRRESDPQIVVIDEVAGVLIALCLAGKGLMWELAAIVLFRVLDIT